VRGRPARRLTSRRRDCVTPAGHGLARADVALADVLAELDRPRVSQESPEKARASDAGGPGLRR